MKKKLALFITCASLWSQAIAAQPNMFEMSTRVIGQIGSNPTHSDWNCTIYPDPMNHCVYGQFITKERVGPIPSIAIQQMRDSWFGPLSLGATQPNFNDGEGILLNMLTVMEERRIKAIYEVLADSGAAVFEAALLEGETYWQMRYAFERYGPSQRVLDRKHWAPPHTAVNFYVGAAHIPPVIGRLNGYFDPEKINSVLAFLNEGTIPESLNLRPFIATNIGLSPSPYYPPLTPPHRPVIAEFSTSINAVGGDTPLTGLKVLQWIQREGFDLGVHMVLVRAWGDIIKVSFWTGGR